MIQLNLSEPQLAELLHEVVSNPKARNRKNALIVCLRELGFSNQRIAKMLQINEDTVTNQVKKCASTGLQSLLQDNFKKKIAP